MFHCCIQDTLSSRAALGLPLGRVRRAIKGIVHTSFIENSLKMQNVLNLKSGHEKSCFTFSKKFVMRLDP